MEVALPDTLIVRRLPECLTEGDLNDLFQFFGARTVKKEKPKGRQNYSTVLVKFDSHQDASYALTRLHQLLVLGKRIVVEYADFSILPASGSQYSNQTDSYVSFKKKSFKYPFATKEIVNKIAETMLDNVEFYHRVLDLMRSLNLPPPFSEVSKLPKLVVIPQTDIQEVEMEELFKEDTEESELETDSEDCFKKSTVSDALCKPTKVKKKLTKTNPLKAALKSSKSLIKKTTPTPRIEEVFEKSAKPTKTLTFKISASEIPLPVPDDNPSLEQIPSSSNDGFGVFNPIPSVDEGNKEGISHSAGIDDSAEYISKQKLKINKLQKEEMDALPVFRNYSTGDPSTRLYVKNLSKSVKNEDLKYIFGRYVSWTSEEERNMFDIRLMTEGRMRGQAFITLPNLDRAKEALIDTNGLMLQGKPLVVQYARSAQTK